MFSEIINKLHLVKLLDKNGDHKLSILKSPVFLIVLFLKVVASVLFGSDYLVKLFIPFVNYYVLSGFENPYNYFYSIGIFNIFPYPEMMLWLLAVPRYLASFLLTNGINDASNLHLFIYRLPLLLADIVIFVILVRWLKHRASKVIWYYWCSPIVFYIVYLHGQLDVIPIAILLLSLYFLFKERWFLAMSILGLALATKTSILIVLPFLFVYFIKKQLDWVKTMLLILIPLLIFALINFNYLDSVGFFRLVLDNKEQFKIFDLSLSFGDGRTIYFIPLIFLLLFIGSTFYKYYSRQLFLMLLAFGFGIFTLLIPPMPGWYFWIIPFIVYFYVKNDIAPKLIFILLNISYFLYFILIKTSDWPQFLQPLFGYAARGQNLYSYLFSLNLPAELIFNLAFTLLQTSLLLNIVWIYKQGLQNSLQSKIVYQPFLIGLAGDSGSGKNHLANLLIEQFGQKNTLMMEGDDMHRWERGDSSWQTYTHLDPRANKLHTELTNASLLKKGQSIVRSFYDHKSGKFTKPTSLEANKIIIFQGLHSLYLNRLRELYDLKIFLSPDESLRINWKIERDMRERGHDKEKIIKQLNSRAADSAAYIKNQEKFADLVVSFFVADDNLIALRLKFDNSLDIEPLRQQLTLMATNLDARVFFHEDWQIIEFRGNINVIELDKIAYLLLPELWEMLNCEPQWQANYDGLIQLFVAYYVYYKIKS